VSAADAPKEAVGVDLLRGGVYDVAGRVVKDGRVTFTDLPITDYPVKGRGGLGVRTILLTDRKGYLVGVRVVRDTHEIVLQSREGVVIRMRADGIQRYGRATQGVRVMNMREGDVVSAVARMVVSESGTTDEEIDAG